MRWLRRHRFGSLGVALIALALVATACASGPDEPDKVHVLTWDGTVNPVMARYIDRGIDAQAAILVRRDVEGDQRLVVVGTAATVSTTATA